VLLLDTHVWIWTLEGDVRRIGRRARALLSRAEGDDQIRISPVTLFEVTALHTLGRLRLSRPLHDWIREALAGAGVRLTDLTPAAAIDAGTIPREALGDPFDRLLVGIARDLEATLLTADRRILDYAARQRNVRTQDAGR
jgi:PIN domain nuclease of toxin-antitoxin system